MADRLTNCSDHGPQPETFVCQHIVESLRTGKRVGFFWSSDDADDPRPDAWCADCNQRVAAAGGEWVGEALEQANVKLLCGACYDQAKKLNLRWRFRVG